MNFNWFIHARTFNGISHLNSLKNSRDIAISIGWTERPSHDDIKYMNSQKSHWTEIFLILLYLLKLNLMGALAKFPNKGKTNILYNVLYSKKYYFVYFFWAKKNIEQKNICPKNSRNSEYAQFLTYDNFP